MIRFKSSLLTFNMMMLACMLTICFGSCAKDSGASTKSANTLSELKDNKTLGESRDQFLTFWTFTQLYFQTNIVEGSKAEESDVSVEEINASIQKKGDQPTANYADFMALEMEKLTAFNTKIGESGIDEKQEITSFITQDAQELYQVIAAALGLESEVTDNYLAKSVLAMDSSIKDAFFGEFRTAFGDKDAASLSAELAALTGKLVEIHTTDETAQKKYIDDFSKTFEAVTALNQQVTAEVVSDTGESTPTGDANAESGGEVANLVGAPLPVLIIAGYTIGPWAYGGMVALAGVVMHYMSKDAVTDTTEIIKKRYSRNELALNCMTNDSFANQNVEECKPYR